MPFRREGSLGSNQRAVMGWNEWFTLLLPYLKKIYQKLKNEFVFISLWQGHTHRYIYHIHPPLRDAMYDYLKEENILKKFGLAFGNDRVVKGGDGNLIDIGLYAFLPFYEILIKHRDDVFGNRKIVDICRAFAENITKDSKSNIELATKNAELLIRFSLEKCADETFHEMLVSSRGEFAEVYSDLYRVANELPQPKKQVALSRFLKGSFRGMYINSEGFVGLALSTDMSAMKSEIEEVASKIGPRALEKLVNTGKMTVFQKLVAFFSPMEKKENVADALDRKFYMSVIMTDKKRYTKLCALFNSFKRLIYGFDFEIADTFKPRAFYHRVPIIIDMYRDKNTKKARSVCAGLNEQIVLAGGRLNIQQIKFSPAKFGGAKERCKRIVRNYYCMDTSAELHSDRGEDIVF